MHKRVLLVSDDPAVRRMLFRLLASEAHHVLLAELDRASLRVALERELDVMVVDVDSHNSDALQALNQAAQQHALPPAILLNSALTETSLSHYQIATVLEKPLDLHELLTAVSAVGTALPSTTP
jgi:DNA-binding response OmpR family regulator